MPENLNAKDTPHSAGPIPLDYARPDVGPSVVAVFPQQWMAAAAHSTLTGEGFRAEVIDRTPRDGSGTAQVYLVVPKDQAEDAVARLRSTAAKPHLLTPRKAP